MGCHLDVSGEEWMMGGSCGLSGSERVRKRTACMQMNDECAGRRVSKRGGTVFLEASEVRRPRGSCTPGRGRDQDGGETGRGREGRMGGTDRARIYICVVAIARTRK